MLGESCCDALSTVSGKWEIYLKRCSSFSLIFPTEIFCFPFFRIEQADDNGLFWDAVAGRVYSVDWTDDLGEPFVEVASGLTVGSYTVGPPANGAANYYRIRVNLE